MIHWLLSQTLDNWLVHASALTNLVLCVWAMKQAQERKLNGFLAAGLMASAFNALLLGATVSAVLSILAGLRQLVATYRDRLAFFGRVCLATLFSVSGVFGALYTMDHPIGYFIASEALLAAWAVFFWGGLKLRVFFLYGAAVWFCTGLVYGQWGLVAATFISLLSLLYGMSRIWLASKASYSDELRA